MPVLRSVGKGCARETVAGDGMVSNDGLTYRGAGVDIDAGEALVEAIRPLARATARLGSTPALGGFGALFDLKAAGYDDPLIVATTDGVGTKLLLAIESGDRSTIGVDLVAMCVNDLLAQGAEPLLFLDYYATSALDPEIGREIVAGIAKGCRLAGCALVGGETAEMPGLYKAGDFDLAGFAVGAVDRARVLPRLEAQRAGDLVVGLASSGVHSNGFSLVRAIVQRAGLAWTAPAPFDPQRSLAQALLEPTRIYVPAVLPLLRTGLIKGAAHITGGGLIENPKRAVASGLEARLDWNGWSAPPVFDWLQQAGDVDLGEMRRTFNCGLGFLLVVAPDDAPKLVAALLEAGEHACVVGALFPA